MNECSFQEYYCSLKVPDLQPQIQLPCHSTQEIWDQEKYPSFKTMSNCRTRETQNSPDVVNDFLAENLETPTSSLKNKKKTGASDPRFKKIIDTEFRNSADSTAGKLGSKLKMPSTTSQRNRGQSLNEKALSYPMNARNCSLFMSRNLKFVLEDQKEQDLSAEVTKDTSLNLTNKYLLNEDINEFSYNEIEKNIQEESLEVAGKLKSSFNTELKRSASDCTLQTKGVLRESESIENVRAYPSASKLLNAGKWMDLQKVMPKERSSVATVIGQSQAKPFNQVLSEIHQRRKLAKELDKHALCEALMSSMETHSDFNNVVAKVDLVLPDGKVIYSTEKVYTRKNNKLEDSVYSQNSKEFLDSGDSRRKKHEMIPERDSSTSQLGKKRLKRLTKKSVLSTSQKNKVKDNLRNIFSDTSSVVFWFLLAVLCLGLCFSITLYIFETPRTYYILKVFKPRTKAWYEKLLFL